MANEPYLFGAGGLVVGVVLGMMSSGPNFDDLEKRLVEKIGAGSAAAAQETSEQITALNDRIGSIEASLAAGAEQSDTASQAVSTQIDSAVATLTGAIGSAGDQQSARLEAAVGAQVGALGAQIDGLSGQIDKVGGGVSGILHTMSSHHGGAGGEAAHSEAAAHSPAEPEPALTGTPVGGTEVFMDGKVRVFVSGIDAEAGTARVAVNGLGLTVLGSYQNVTFDVDGVSCKLLLDSITNGRVEMSPNCPE